MSIALYLRLLSVGLLCLSLLISVRPFVGTVRRAFRRKEATMSRGFDLDSFGMDDFRESDSYDRGRETGAGRVGGSRRASHGRPPTICGIS